MRSISVAWLLLALLLTAAGIGMTASAAPALPAAQASSACLDGAKACGKCGDGYCAAQCGENASSCPADCGIEAAARACGKCGDGVCTPQCGENARTCPQDCLPEAEI